MEDSETTPTEGETITTEPSQTSVQEELEREQGKQTRSEKEKAAFSLRKNAERAKELGIDPAEVLGFSTKEVQEGDDAPATVGTVRQLLAEKERATAEQLADEITDPSERELTKLYLKRVVPSGDAQEDLRFARLAVTSAKSKQTLEEVGRISPARGHISSAGAPANKVETEVELSKEEQQFLKPPFSLTKEQVLQARKG